MTQGPRPAQAPRATQAPTRTQAPTGRPIQDRARRTAGPPTGTTGRPSEDSADHPLSVGREVRRTLHGVSSRQAQRRRLVYILALAQLLVDVAVIPGYLSPSPAIGSLVVLSAAIAVALLALAASGLFNHVISAAYILVFGGGLVTLAHMIVTGLAGDVRTTAQASLFFLPMILEAGVLFSAEVTLMLVAVATTLTAVGLAFALYQGKIVPGNEIYLIVVYSLSLEAFAGLIAWLVAQFLFESGSEAQRAAQFRFIQAQLDALQSVQARQQHQLQAEIGALQDAITRVLSGAYVARVDVVPGELAELMQSFNLLLDHIHSMVGTEQGRDKTNELVGQMLVLIGEIAEGSASSSRAGNPNASGPLGAVMQALLHLQTRTAYRYAKIEQVVSDMAGAVQTGLDGLSNTAQDMQTATGIAGRLVSAVDQHSQAIKGSHTVVLHARDLVGKLLPPALLQAAAQDAVHRDASGMTPDEAAQFLGRNDDLTGLDVLDILDAGATSEFAVLQPRDDDATNLAIPPLTIPLPAVRPNFSEAQADAAAEDAGALGDQSTMQARLLELWRMLDQLAATLAHEYRALQSTSRELSKLSRSVRNADSGFAHGVASLEATRETIKDLQEIARPNRNPVYPEQYPSAPPRPPTGSGSRQGTPDERPRAAELLGLETDDQSPSGFGDGGQLNVRQLIDPDVLGNSSSSGSGGRPRREDDSRRNPG